MFIDEGNGLIGSRKFGPTGYVFDAAIGVVRSNDQRLRSANRHQHLLRQHLDTIYGRIVFRRTVRTKCNPTCEKLVIGGIDRQSQSTFMFDGATRLRQHQRRCRIVQVDSSPSILTRDIEVICCGIVSTQREFKATLARERTMTGSHVATIASQNGLDVIAELDRGRLRGLPNHRRQNRLALCLRI